MIMLDNIEALLALEKKATPTKWLALEDAPGKLTVISNPRHPIWKDGVEKWGQKEASETPDAKFVSDLRNTAHDLLAALDFRRGDAEMLADLRWSMVNHCDIFFKDERFLELVVRYENMARKMEQEEK